MQKNRKESYVLYNQRKQKQTESYQLDGKKCKTTLTYVYTFYAPVKISLLKGFSEVQQQQLLDAPTHLLEELRFNALCGWKHIGV